MHPLSLTSVEGNARKVQRRNLSSAAGLCKRMMNVLSAVVAPVFHLTVETTVHTYLCGSDALLF